MKRLFVGLTTVAMFILTVPATAQVGVSVGEHGVRLHLGDRDRHGRHVDRDHYRDRDHHRDRDHYRDLDRHGSRDRDHRRH
jgi:hypothetical protein